MKEISHFHPLHDDDSAEMPQSITIDVSGIKSDSSKINNKSKTPNSEPRSKSSILYIMIICSFILAPVSVIEDCLLYTSPSPRDKRQSRMPSSA